MDTNKDMLLFSNANDSQGDEGNNTSMPWITYEDYDANSSFFFDKILEDFKKSLFMTDNPVTIIIISCYILVFVFALLGNLLVLLVILTNKTMRTSITNSYLLNLAVADLLVTLVCIPLTVGETVYKVWVYSFFLCKATLYLQGICISASVLTIMALSLDRYVAIRHPVRSRQTSSATCVRITIVGIWVVSGFIMVPMAIVRGLSHHALPGGESVAFCGEHWPSVETRTAYDTFLFIFIYILPGSVVIFSYSSTGCRLLARDNMLQRNDSEAVHGAKVLAGRRRLARMLLVLAILFAVSWMPYHAVNLYMDYDPSVDVEKMRGLLSLAVLLGHSHSAQNPILYCFMNRNFKKGVRRLLKCGAESLIDTSFGRRNTWNRGTRRTVVERRKSHEKQESLRNSNSSNDTNHLSPQKIAYRNMTGCPDGRASSVKSNDFQQPEIGQSTEMTPLAPAEPVPQIVKTYDSSS